MNLELFTQDNPLGFELSNILQSGKYTNFKFLVAYAKNSGIGRLYKDLKTFSENGGTSEAIIGIDQSITSYQALGNLNTLTNSNLYIHHDKGSVSFHPKVYLFGNQRIEKIIVGSSNLTAGGLFTNFEANIGVSFLGSTDFPVFRSDIDKYWSSLLKDKNTKKADINFIDNLFQNGALFDENKLNNFQSIISKTSKIPFGGRSTPKLPELILPQVSDVPKLLTNFSMTLSGFDVSSRSQDPVILIPLASLHSNPLFWNWPLHYTLSGSHYPELYAPASIEIDGNIIHNYILRIYYYDRKSEFRLQCEPIKRRGEEGDIITIQKDPSIPLGYIINLVRKDSLKYKHIFEHLKFKVSVKKRFGFY